jgi:hypothetical protein
VRGFVGLVIGLAIGAGAMYLVLRPPWAGRGAVTSDAGVVAVASTDAGTAKAKKKPRRHASGASAHPGDPSAPPGTIDSEGDNGPDDPGPAAIVLTAADRVPEWRGDDVVQPPRTVDMNGDARALEQSEIDSTISGQASGVRDCVVQGATGTDLRATITVKMLVDGSGRVTKSRVQGPHYMQGKGLLECTRRALGGMHFPATGAPTVVTLPVNLG